MFLISLQHYTQIHQDLTFERNTSRSRLIQRPDLLFCVCNFIFQRSVCITVTAVGNGLREVSTHSECGYENIYAKIS